MTDLEIHRNIFIKNELSIKEYDRIEEQPDGYIYVDGISEISGNKVSVPIVKYKKVKYTVLEIYDEENGYGCFFFDLDGKFTKFKIEAY